MVNEVNLLERQMQHGHATSRTIEPTDKEFDKLIQSIRNRKNQDIKEEIE
jgi:hypothetical protein